MLTQTVKEDSIGLVNIIDKDGTDGNTSLLLLCINNQILLIVIKCLKILLTKNHPTMRREQGDPTSVEI